MPKLKTDGSDGKGEVSSLRNAIEILSNIFYLIEVDPNVPESIKRILPFAESAMKTLKEQARLELTSRPDRTPR